MFSISLVLNHLPQDNRKERNLSFGMLGSMNGKESEEVDKGIAECTHSL